MVIFLVGFMGVGKSSIGKKLSARVGCPFVDSDFEISQKAGKSVAAIFRDEGESHFRKLESEWLVRFSINNAVVALGGGLPCTDENISLIRQKGISVFIDLPAGMIAHRLEHSIGERPLLKNISGKEQLCTFVENRLNQRLKYYSQSTVTVDGRSHDIVDLILAAVERHKI